MKTIVKDEKRLNRRDFLMVASFASLAGLFGQAGIALFDFFKRRSKPGSFGSIVNAGQVEEFIPGTVSHISIGRFYISRPGRDAAVIGGVAFDKRALIRGQPTCRVERTNLEELRARFARHANRAAVSAG